LGIVTVQLNEVFTDKIRYLASVFVDAHRVVATPPNVRAFLDALDDADLLPTTVQEIGLSGNVARMAFNSADGRSQLVLAGNRFDYSFQAATPEGSDLGSFATFCHEAETKLITAITHFKLRGTRLAAVQEGYLLQTADDGLDPVMARLMNRPSTYRAGVLRDWTWRANVETKRRLGSLTEATNTITTVGLVPGYTVFGEQGAHVERFASDRIRLDFDINTVPENTVPRFNKSHVHTFFLNAPKWHDKLVDDMLGYILDRGA